MSRLLTSFNRKFLLHALAVLLVFAQTMVLTHKIAHAGTSAAAAVELRAQTPDDGRLDLFGHGAGLACDDWNAAFALDANPGTGAAAVVLHLDGAIAPGLVSSVILPAAPAGFSQARAPPRA